MEKHGFFSPIFSPSGALAEWSSDPGHSKSLRPGMTWLAATQAVFGLMLFALAWGVALGLEALAKAVGPTVPDRIFALMPQDLLMTRAGDALVWILISIVWMAAGRFVSAWIAVRALDGKVERSRCDLLFNLANKMTLPWEILFVVPVLGWIAMSVGMLFNLWRVFRSMFSGGSTKLLGPFIGSQLAGFLTLFLLQGLLHAVLAPLSGL